MANRIWTWLHRFSSPPNFYRVAGKWLPWLAVPALLLAIIGLYGGLVLAPTDYQQGDSYRIIYVHVPSAWLSLFVYLFMATSAGMALIWRIKLAEVMAISAAPIGASFTFIALVTGAIWGKPTWGAWWVWDARLTSELILLFLYLGYMALYHAIEDPRSASRAAGILALIGAVNVPIVHYSVEWWHTMHQGPLFEATASGVKTGLKDPTMIWSLLTMVVAFQLFFFFALLLQARAEVLQRERRSRWVRELANG